MLLRRRPALARVAVLLCACFSIAACEGLDEPRVDRTGPCKGCGALADRALRGEVTAVVDGDTVRVLLRDGTTERVRLLGIDAPELTELRTGRRECGGPQARAAAVRLANDQRDVFLVPDPEVDARDRYGRLLAYIVPAGQSVSWQEELLRSGWVQPYVLSGQSIERLGRFRAEAGEAKRRRAGVWALCGGDFRRPR